PAGLGLLQQSRTRREAWLLAAMESCLTEQEQAQLIEAGALMARLAAAPSTDAE
ncbi:MarR family transcriptional regulator, partial [Serratia marcescens]